MKVTFIPFITVIDTFTSKVTCISLICSMKITMPDTYLGCEHVISLKASGCKTTFTKTTLQVTRQTMVNDWLTTDDTWSNIRNI